MKVRHELNDTLYEKNIYEKRSVHPPELAQFYLVQQGDVEAVREQLDRNEITLLADDRKLSENADRNLMYHFVNAASDIARACMESGLGYDEAQTLAAIYIRKADLYREKEAILTLFREMCLDFAERMQEIKKYAVTSLHIRKCIDYIYHHLNADLSLKALAELAGLHPSYLSRLFAKETGTSVKQFVIAARIDIAKHLLKYSDLPYSEISEALGFSSQSAFIHVFKNIAGMTPKKYRDRFYDKNGILKNGF